MAAIPGTNVPASLTPFDTADTYGTHNEIYGIGGSRSVIDLTARDAITAERRAVGMTVYVISTDTKYQLKGGISNSNWVLADKLSNLKDVTFTNLQPGQILITDGTNWFNGAGSPATSGSFGQGSLPLNTINQQYTILHTTLPSISAGYPIVSLQVPSSGSNLLEVAILNRTVSSFDIILSQVPNVSGYFINWSIGGGIGGNTIVGNLGTIIGGQYIEVVENPASTFTISVTGMAVDPRITYNTNDISTLYSTYTNSATTQAISAGLDSRITYNTNDISTLYSTYTNSATTQAISAGLDSRIAAISISAANIANYVLKSGDMMSGQLIHNAGVTSPFGAGINNEAFGNLAGNYSSTGSNNTALGAGAMAKVTSGSWNNAIGAGTLANLTTGNNNVASGQGALASLVNGNNLIALGQGAGGSLVAGGWTVAMGQGAIANATGLSECIFIGAFTGLGITNSNVYDSILIGFYAGSGYSGTPLVNGPENVILGAYADVATPSQHRSITIGAFACAPASNTCRIGDISLTEVGTYAAYKMYGTTSGHASIKVASNAGTPADLVLPTTSGTNGQVLTTDGSGNLSWANSGGGQVTLVSAPTPTTSGTKGTWGYYGGYIYRWVDTSVVVRSVVETSW